MLSFYCLLYLICLPGFTDQKILGISVPVNLCFNQSSFLLYWQKVRFYIRFFPVNKDCNRDMARFPPVFDTNPPATACVSGVRGNSRSHFTEWRRSLNLRRKLKPLLNCLPILSVKNSPILLETKIS